MNINIISIAPEVTILFHGFKPLTKHNCHLELIIAHHNTRHYYEILAYHPQLDQLAPRVYLDYDLMMTAIALEPKHISSPDFMMKYIFDHLDIQIIHSHKHHIPTSFRIIFMNKDNQILDLFNEKSIRIHGIDIDLFTQTNNFQQIYHNSLEDYQKVYASYTHKDQEFVDKYCKQLEEELQNNMIIRKHNKFNQCNDMNHVDIDGNYIEDNN